MKKKINAKEPTNFDQYESMDYIWEVLCDYREHHLNKFENEDDIWDEICSSMSWIEDALGMRHGKPLNVGSQERNMEDVLEGRHEAMQRFTNKLNEKE